MQTRTVVHSPQHIDIEKLRRDENGAEVWAVIKCYNGEDSMSSDLRFTPAVLVTGEDERGNEFAWFYSNKKFVDVYNEAEVTAAEFRAIYPQVYKVYFSDTVMSGDQWRDLQCPLSLSNIQIAAWLEQQPPADVAHALEQAMDAESRIDSESAFVDTGLTDDRPYRAASFDFDADLIPF